MNERDIVSIDDEAKAIIERASEDSLASPIPDLATVTDHLFGSVTANGPASGSAETMTYAQAINRARSEEHTSELQSLMRISYAVFCLKNKKHYTKNKQP